MMRVSPPELARALPGPQGSIKVTRTPRSRKARAVKLPNTPAPTTATWRLRRSAEGAGAVPAADAVAGAARQAVPAAAAAAPRRTSRRVQLIARHPIPRALPQRGFHGTITARTKEAA